MFFRLKMIAKLGGDAMNNENNKYAFKLSLGIIIMIEELIEMEENSERKKKKYRILEMKEKLFYETFQGFVVNIEIDKASVLKKDWTNLEAKAFIIDLAFVNPFAPYQLECKDKHFKNALTKVAAIIGLSEKGVESILKTQQEATEAHKHFDWINIAIWGLGGLVILGTGGWLAAPYIGSAIGGAAGLVGAAATSHGLAILGGGSLALGGLGMSGGMWIVTGASAAIGLLGASSANALVQMGAASAKLELIKLQVSFKENIFCDQMNSQKAHDVITSLYRQQLELEKQYENEKKLNDDNSGRIKNIEDTLKSFKNAIQWMEKEYKSARGN